VSGLGGGGDATVADAGTGGRAVGLYGKVNSLDFNGPRAADGTGHFGLLVRRTADDIRGGPQLLGGKGAVDCDSQRLIVPAIGIRP
jgi:hypothetical protein